MAQRLLHIIWKATGNDPYYTIKFGEIHEVGEQQVLTEIILYEQTDRQAEEIQDFIELIYRRLENLIQFHARVLAYLQKTYLYTRKRITVYLPIDKR